jgi:hypothetical protein
MEYPPWPEENASASGRSGPRAALITAIAARGLQPQNELQQRIKARIESFGGRQTARLPIDVTAYLSAERVRWCLGTGFALTEFLIAPVLGAASPESICSLGALANLMVVICDRLLDRGVDVDRILPTGDLAQHDSPVLVLLQHYRKRLAMLSPDDQIRAVIERLIARMMAAERRTVSDGEQLPSRDWLRKSAFPFMLMGLPAWTCSSCDERGRSQSILYERHLMWLCRTGRFFGAIDDAADYYADGAAATFNLFRSSPEEDIELLCSRVSDWGKKILCDWTLYTGDGSKAVIFKETFLNLTWSWLHAT